MWGIAAIAVLGAAPTGVLSTDLLSQPMDWEGLGSIIGGVGTILAVIVAALSFGAQRRFTDRLKAIADIRRDALEIERKITAIDRQINEEFFSNRGLAIAEEVVRISGAANAQEFVAFLSDEENFNLIVSGVYRGQNNDQGGTSMLADIDALIALADNNRLYFPILSRGLGASVTAASNSVRALLRASMVLPHFKVEDMRQQIIAQIQTSPNITVLTARLGDRLGNTLQYMAQNVAQKRFDIMETIIKDFTGFIVNAEESDLHALIKSRRKNEAEYRRKEAKTWSGDVAVAANILRGMLGANLRNKIVKGVEEYEGLLEENNG